MAVKLFVLGLPGSGKSSIARLVSMYARDRQWSTIHFSDYPILYEMFQEDKLGQFKLANAEFGGFDVLDLTVFDIALKKLEQKVNRNISSTNSEELLLIEFARNDYQQAFHQFNDKFLQDAYFLYLNADLDICKQRIRDRIAEPISDDDHYVSDYIFEAYYHGDNGQCLSNILEGEYKINKQRILVIDNNCSLEEASRQIAPFIDRVIAFSTDVKDTADNSSSSFEESLSDDKAAPPTNNPVQPAPADLADKPGVLVGV
jgi:adenylate kinase family enzyme